MSQLYVSTTLCLNFMSHQCVSLNQQNSSLKEIECGVPQGSLLGPLLFIVYSNDFSRSSDVLSFILFADGSNVFFSHNNPNIIFIKIKCTCYIPYSYHNQCEKNQNINEGGFGKFTTCVDMRHFLGKIVVLFFLTSYRNATNFANDDVAITTNDLTR